MATNHEVGSSNLSGRANHTLISPQGSTRGRIRVARTAGLLRTANGRTDSP